MASQRQDGTAHASASGPRPPRTSVVLPVYNTEGSLAEAIASVSAQSDEDWELIAVDDGSTDHTPDVLRELAAGEPRLRLFAHPVNRGVVAALNRGISEARGTYIARMDADDVSARDRLRQQCSFLGAHPEIGLVGCRVEFGGNRGTHAGYAAYVDWTNSLLTPEQLFLNRFVESPLAHPSVMFRRELPQRFGGYREGRFPEDYELWLRWLEAGVRMAKLPDYLLRWNDPPNRLSRADERYSFRAFYRCKAAYLAKWLTANNPHHPDVVVWGAGRETRKRADHIVEHGVRISSYIDVDPRRIGQTIRGRRVHSEAELAPPQSCFVLSYVSSRGARRHIRSRLLARGFVEGRSFLMCA